MALSTEEEETLEALKRWWDETGQKLAVGIALVLAGWLGWTMWQGAQQSTAAEASAVYDELSGMVAVQPGQSVGANQRANAQELVEQLKSDYGGTAYALYGSLIGARLAVDANELAQAEEQLQWVLDNRGGGLFARTEPTLELLTQLRMGRVVLARGEPDRALTVISGLEPGAYESDFAELRGDIYVAQGQNEQAVEAYRRALETTSSGSGRMVQLKLDDLGADS